MPAYQVPMPTARTRAPLIPPQKSARCPPEYRLGQDTEWIRQETHQMRGAIAEEEEEEEEEEAGEDEDEKERPRGVM